METVDLPVQPPVEPMLAKAATAVPDEPGVWSYEPKWDFTELVNSAKWLGAEILTQGVHEH